MMKKKNITIHEYIHRKKKSLDVPKFEYHERILREQKLRMEEESQRDTWLQAWFKEYWSTIAIIIWALSGFLILENWEPEIYEWHEDRRAWQRQMLKEHLIYDFLYYFIEVLGYILPILIAVAFTTLLERKVLAAIQRRVGPNVVGYKGFGQPFADALKLLLKEMVIPTSSSRVLFLIAPMFTIPLSLMT